MVPWENTIETGKTYHIESCKIRVFDDCKYVNTNEDTKITEIEEITNFMLDTPCSMNKWKTVVYKIISAGLTIWQKRHMAQAPHFWGPCAYSLLIFPKFFVPCFRAGPKQCASAGPQRVLQKTCGPKMYKNGAPQNSAPTNGAPKNGPQTFFLCFSARGPKEPKVPRNVGAQNLKIEAPKSEAPNCFFLQLVSAWGDPNSAGPQSFQGPPKIKKCEAPKFKKIGSKSRVA